MNEKEPAQQEIVEAIQDLTRVMLSLDNQLENKSDVIRRLSTLSMPPTRIASLLGMKTKDVSSVLNKAKKRAGNKASESNQELTDNE